jgi:hypothetical protein
VAARLIYSSGQDGSMRFLMVACALAILTGCANRISGNPNRVVESPFYVRPEAASFFSMPPSACGRSSSQPCAPRPARPHAR